MYTYTLPAATERGRTMVLLSDDEHKREPEGAQFSITGYHTRLIHLIQCFVEISMFLVSEGYV